MTQEEIKEMAKKVYGDTNWTEASLSRLEIFAKLVAAKAIAKAIKELESQEPVAWVNQSAIDWLNGNMQGSNEYVQTNLAKRKNNSATVPIFTHPLKREWVDLTDKEAQWLYDNCRTSSNLIDMVEAKLKEKNT